MNDETDVLVIGAGVAGLTTAADLSRAGARVLLIEARDRIGGRIHTVRENGGFPVELGAEFIHGRAPEIWDFIEAERLPTVEVKGDTWCAEHGKLRRCAFFEEDGDVLDHLKAPENEDVSFMTFLRDYSIRNPSVSEETLRWALQYVEGFEAADPARISVRSMLKEFEAERKIQGGNSWRLTNGYGSLVAALRARIDFALCTLHLNTILSAIHWKRHKVQAVTSEGTFSAPKAVITLPLGVLQQPPDSYGSVRFDPELKQRRSSLQLLAMGPAIRISLVFEEAFWECLPHAKSEAEPENVTMEHMSFLFSHDERLPTWWTLRPRRAPILTGWAGGPAGARLSHHAQSFVLDAAAGTLALLLGVSKAELHDMVQRWYVHDWQADPFSRGAYSYVLAGGMGTLAPEAELMGSGFAQLGLAEPLNDTLFFAGEATESEGHHATVHGAIATGHRAAREVLREN